MKRTIALLGLAVILAGLLASTAPAAKASSKQSTTTDGSPVCFKWHFREYRDGLSTHSLLWRIDQTVYWCTDFHNHFTRGPTVTRSHDVGSLWAWDGWTDVITAQHKTNPNRYVFRVQAALHSLLPLPFTDLREHNKPYIRQTVYPSPGQSTWAASCGCHNAVTVKTQ